MASQRRRQGAPSGPQLRVDAFELSEPEALGADVRLEVGPRRTVLVGRNGAGKSATLEGISKAISDALEGHRSRLRRREIDVRRFRCEMSVHPERSDRIAYEFKQSEARDAPSSSGEPTRQHFEWTEKCWRMESESTIWEVSNGLATAPGAPQVRLQPGTGLLSVDADPGLPFANEVERVRAVFLNVGRVQAGVPRSERNFRLYFRSSTEQSWASTGAAGGGRHDRIDTIALSLLRWHEHDRPRFDEFVEMGRRMGVWQTVRPLTFKAERPIKEQPGEFGVLDFDEVSSDERVNVGLLADGTLRVAEILRAILRPQASVLLVEEPETSVHPGLLRKLLAEVDSYSINCQVILTTHSPQVVASSQPEEVRLVRRHQGRTVIDPLTPQQLTRVGEYLAEDGTLGDFVFGGAADD